MADRRSGSSYNGTVEEAQVGIKADAKTINQLSSSAKACQIHRARRAVESLVSAIEGAKDDEGEGSQAKKGEGKRTSDQQSSGQEGKR